MRFRAILEQPFYVNPGNKNNNPFIPPLNIRHPLIKIVKHKPGETVLDITSDSKELAYKLVNKYCPGYFIISLKIKN